MHWFRLHQPTFITYSLRLAIVESFRWAQFHGIHDQLVLCMHLTCSIKHVYIQMIHVIPAQLKTFSKQTHCVQYIDLQKQAFCCRLAQLSLKVAASAKQ
jgi:hypothetical protein